MIKLAKKTIVLSAFLVGAGLDQEVLAQEPMGAWSSQCISRMRASEAVCTVSHRVTVQETGQVLFFFEVRTRPGSEPDMIVTAPVGFYLPDGIKLSVDGAPLLELVIERCDQNSCYAQNDLTNDAISSMQGGEKLTVTFSPTRNRSQSLELPLAGFGSAYDGISILVSE